MFTNTFDALNIYQQGNGSMTFCLTDIGEKAEAAGLDLVCDRVATAQDACSFSQRLNDQWANSGQTGLPSRTEAVKTNALIVRTISQICDVCSTFASQHRDSPRKTAARQIVDRAFPRGVRPIVSMRFEEQHATVDFLIKRLRSELHTQVAYIGVEDLVADLNTYNNDFAKQLAVHDDVLTFDRVATARVAAREAFAAVIVQVLADTLGQPDLRADLLASLRDQQGRLALHHRRRGKLPPLSDAEVDIIDLPQKPEDDLDLPASPDAE